MNLKSLSKTHWIPNCIQWCPLSKDPFESLTLFLNSLSLYVCVSVCLETFETDHEQE
jgi:hypothetical protein